MLPISEMKWIFSAKYSKTTVASSLIALIIASQVHGLHGRESKIVISFVSIYNTSGVRFTLLTAIKWMPNVGSLGRNHFISSVRNERDLSFTCETRRSVSVHWVACGTRYTKTKATELGSIELQRSS